MTSILLYWNHICVLHRQEKAFLEDLAQRLRGDGIRLEVRYFGLGYPERMSEYLARPDAILPDLIVSADLEVFEDLRIFSKFKSNLYPAADWVPPLSSALCLHPAGVLYPGAGGLCQDLSAGLARASFRGHQQFRGKNGGKVRVGAVGPGGRRQAPGGESGGRYANRGLSGGASGADQHRPGSLPLCPPSGRPGDLSPRPPGGAGPDPLLSLCPRFCAGVGGPPGGRAHSLP